MTAHNHSEIRTRPRPRCYLCGAQGEELYEGLTDRLFDAPGVWSLKRCPGAGCGLVWLDPVPVEEDIALAYRSYYTHQSADAGNGVVALAHRTLWGIAARATGLVREQRAIWYAYLGDRPPGKLLEIGCGSGDYLARMKALGWIVEGVEIDPDACRHARDAHGLTVHEGTLEARAYPSDGFDAVVLNHVIEHVFDPVGLLRECRRVVKRGRPVVAITPNAESWARQKFQASWTGWDPPRHLQVFSSTSLTTCAATAGFKQGNVATTPANVQFFIGSSLAIENSGYYRMNDPRAQGAGMVRGPLRKSRHLAYSLLEYLLWRRKPGIGEELVMICHK